jgi:hypothetical protein
MERLLGSRINYPFLEIENLPLFEGCLITDNEQNVKMPLAVQWLTLNLPVSWQRAFG